MVNSEAIEAMDTALSGLVVMFIQLFVDKFQDEADSDGDDFKEIQQFLDNVIFAYCAVLDDEDHAEVIFKRIDEVTDAWLQMKEQLFQGIQE